MGTLAGHAGDCERIIDGLLDQPVNALSSLALVVAGVVVFTRVRVHPTREPVGVMAGVLILAGLGSAAFHGFGGRVATWVHDASLTGLPALLLTIEVSRRSGKRWSAVSWWPAWTGIAAVSWISPAITLTIAAGAAAAAVILVLAPARRSKPDSNRAIDNDRRRSLLLPIALMAAGFIVFQLSRTDGPLCDPDSLLQGHAVWHVLAGAGLAAYGVRISRDAPSGPVATPASRRRR